ncbi:hypothetical protein [Okeania sp. SIO2B3]|nr:hypothetical protein [Okeania sp. SIO2B3]
MKKPKFPVDIHPWIYTNDTSGHDIRKYQIWRSLYSGFPAR